MFYLKQKILFLSGLLLILLFTMLVISIVFVGQSWWIYVLIYAVLIYLWYKPLLVIYHSTVARHMLKEMNYTGVSAEYNKIAQLRKNEGYGDYAQGIAHYYQKQWIHAKQALQKALDKGITTQKKSMEPLAKIILMTTFIELGELNKVKRIIAELDEDIQKKGKIPPKLYSVYYPIKAEWQYHQGMHTEAIQSFATAYEYQPELIGEEAYYYAKLLIEDQQFEHAQSILDDLLLKDNRWKFFRISEADAVKLKQEANRATDGGL